MNTLMMIFAYGWALLGVANVALIPFGEWSTNMVLAGIVLNLFVFIFPGYLVGGKAQDRIKKCKS
jgi:hypothetical protein